VPANRIARRRAGHRAQGVESSDRRAESARLTSGAAGAGELVGDVDALERAL